MTRIVLRAILFLAPAGACALPEDTATSASPRGFVGAPFVKYAPETGFAGGAVGLYYLRFTGDTARDARPSSISGGVTYTQKKQFSTGVDYDFYFGGGRYHWSGGVDYKRIPFDFYGIGNGSPRDPVDNYTPLWRGGDAEFTRNLYHTDEGEGLNGGIALEIRDDRILASNPGGSIASGAVAGSRGGLSSGAGLVVLYDTRDNIFSSHTGGFVKVKSMSYGAALGSSFTFTRYDIDLREFFPASGTQTIALQALAEFVRGSEPFYTMAQLGGDVNTRGYFQGRFRDRDMAVVQGEYRFPLFWRFGVAAFAAAGEVAGALDGFKASGLKCSAGAGIRFLVVPDERLGVRLDYGAGRDSSELYFSILEAF